MGNGAAATRAVAQIVLLVGTRSGVRGREREADTGRDRNRGDEAEHTPVDRDVLQPRHVFCRHPRQRPRTGQRDREPERAAE